MKIKSQQSDQGMGWSITCNLLATQGEGCKKLGSATTDGALQLLVDSDQVSHSGDLQKFCSKGASTKDGNSGGGEFSVPSVGRGGEQASEGNAGAAFDSIR